MRRFCFLILPTQNCSWEGANWLDSAVVYRPCPTPNNSQSLKCTSEHESKSSVLRIRPREFIQDDNLFHSGLFRLIITIGFRNPRGKSWSMDKGKGSLWRIKRQSAVKNANINTKTKDVPSPFPTKKNANSHRPALNLQRNWSPNAELFMSLHRRQPMKLCAYVTYALPCIAIQSQCSLMKPCQMYFSNHIALRGMTDSNKMAVAVMRGVSKLKRQTEIK